jgi:hypothetical protein
MEINNIKRQNLMNFLYRSLCLITTIFILSGCDSKNRAIWSPDGTKLGILAADGFRLSSETGELSQPLMQKPIALFSWFSDSKTVAVVSKEYLTNWADVKAQLSAKDAQDIIEAAPKLMDVIRSEKDNAGKSQDDDSGQIAKHWSDLGTFSKWAAAIVYIKQEYQEELKTIASKKWRSKELDGFGVEFHCIDIFELQPTVKRIKRLYSTTNKILELRVSPGDKQIAFVEEPETPTNNSSSSGHRLSVISVDGGHPLVISTHSSDYPDWKAASQLLVYCDAETGTGNNQSSQEPTFGIIKQVPTCDNNDHLLEKVKDSQSLAYVRFSRDTRIRCLKNNTILFSAPEIHLPATPVDVNGNIGLFAINPGKIPTVIRLSRCGSNYAQEGDLDSFEPSPDSNYAAVPMSSGQVNILDLHTGALQTLQTDNFESPKDLYLMPQWRNFDELTFATHLTGKLKSKHKGDIVLWSMSKQNGTVLSKDWPNRALKDFLQ